MKIYKVGGAVRDQLLGLFPQDNDYVVVGSNIQEMEALGFKAVGKSFPVFLHPKTKEEYALARTEKKTGKKHTDFEFVFTSDITLLQDLERRDFTCNAIAFDEETKEYIDYFNGIQDIQNKVLRCVNEKHFIEDPLRVLRACRFASTLGFEIEPNTLNLLKKMVLQGAMQNLPAERIFEEVVKALKAQKSSRFFLLMHQIGALKEIMQEVDILFSVPEKEKYHPEKNTGGHVMTALDVLPSASPLIKFAVLTHDLGKALTPKNILPSHHGHADRAKEPVRNLCHRLKVPNIWYQFSSAVAKWHMHYFEILNMRPSKIYALLQGLTIGHQSYLKEYIEVCRADFESSSCENRKAEREIFNLKAKLLELSEKTVNAVKAADLENFEKLPKDAHLGVLLKEQKIKALTTAIAEFKQHL